MIVRYIQVSEYKNAYTAHYGKERAFLGKVVGRKPGFYVVKQERGDEPLPLTDDAGKDTRGLVWQGPFKFLAEAEAAATGKPTATEAPTKQPQPEAGDKIVKEEVHG
jgi:hypothetical protein